MSAHRRFRAPIILPALLLVAGLIAVSCGGGGESPSPDVQEEQLTQEQLQKVQDYAPGEIGSDIALQDSEAAEPTADDNVDFIREKVTEGKNIWPFVALDNPEFITADEATFLDAQDLVLGVSLNGESKAYPTSMMWFHHVANDTIGGEPIAVTY